MDASVRTYWQEEPTDVLFQQIEAGHRFVQDEADITIAFETMLMIRAARDYGVYPSETLVN